MASGPDLETARGRIVQVVLWMGGTLLSFSAVAIAIRSLAGALSVFEILAARSFVGLAILLGLGIARAPLRRTLSLRRIWLHIARNTIHFGGQYLWALGLALLPLATVFALEFTMPAFTVLLAALMLGERLTPSRIGVVLFGLAGKLVILRPGLGSFQPTALLIIVAALSFALSLILLKRLETGYAIVFYMNLIQFPLALAGSDPFFVLRIDVPALLAMLALGFFGLSAHYCTAKAFAVGDARLAVPLDFLRLPLIPVVGWLLYASASTRSYSRARPRSSPASCGICMPKRAQQSRPIEEKGSLPQAPNPLFDPHFGHHFSACSGAANKACSRSGRAAGVTMRAGHRRFGAVILVAWAMSCSALAQAPLSPVCGRLEGQLSLINRGGDPGQQEQVRRYEEALSRQQSDLDRLIAQSRRLGCESMGIFSLFTNQPAECRPLSGQIQEMRANISRRQVELQRLQGGDLEGQRQSVIAALAQNNCGPQYQAAANQQRGFFATLFGVNPILPTPDGFQSSVYRTLCVRTCDGYYFPISFQASPARFPEDEQTCQRLCPASEVALYTHRNPGEEVGQSVSLAGRPYRDLPTAFRYRQLLDQACSCRKPGQSWAEALGVGRDTTVERGDIVVTEERSRAMAQPRTDAQGRPIRAPQGSPGATTAPAPATTSPTASASEPADTDMPSGPVRRVGPLYVPTR